jgi:hypothetical protein
MESERERGLAWEWWLFPRGGPKQWRWTSAPETLRFAAPAKVSVPAWRLAGRRPARPGVPNSRLSSDGSSAGRAHRRDGSNPYATDTHPSRLQLIVQTPLRPAHQSSRSHHDTKGSSTSVAHAIPELSPAARVPMSSPGVGRCLGRRILAGPSEAEAIRIVGRFAMRYA